MSTISSDQKDQVDLLVGFEYAGLHPTRVKAMDHLLIMENRFGKCLGGTHPTIRETTKMITAAAMIHHVSTYKIDDFL